MGISVLWNIVLISTVVIAALGAFAQFWYVSKCRQSSRSFYWVGIKVANGVTLLFVAFLTMMFLLSIPVNSLFPRLAIFLLVYDVAAGGLISMVRVLRTRYGEDDPCD